MFFFVDVSLFVCFGIFLPFFVFFNFDFVGKGRAGSVVEKVSGKVDNSFKQSSSVVVETVTKSQSSSKIQSLSSAMHATHSDASKVVVKGIGAEKAYLNKQNQFSVKADSAGADECLVDPLTEWSIDRLIDLIWFDRLIDWFYWFYLIWSIDWLIWLIWFVWIDWLIDWLDLFGLIDWLIDWFVLNNI